MFNIFCNITGCITVSLGHCVTWDNETLIPEPVVNHCPLPVDVACVNDGFFSNIQIPANISGPEINSITCKQYNRQGTQCSQCIEGYGPAAAAFSDGFTCADCSSHHFHHYGDNFEHLYHMSTPCLFKAAFHFNQASLCCQSIQQ